MDVYRNSYASTKRIPPLKETAKKVNHEDFEEESETPSARRKEKGKEKEIYRNSNANTKKMPPLKEAPKKAYCEDCEEESETRSARRKEKGKGRETVAHQQEEETTGIQFLSLGASIKPRPEKPGSKHGKRLDFYLNKYRDEMAGQDEDEEGEGEEEEREEEGEEEGVGYPGVSERAEPLSRKRSFGEADLHPSDESESGTLRVRRSRRSKPDTGGRLNTPGASRRLGRLG